MSELVKRLHDAENLCNKLGFSGSARAIFDARKRITELEASLADSNEALQVMGLKLAHAEGSIDAIGRLASHNIPPYAFGDNEAACDMAGRLSDIQDLSHSANTVGPTPGAAPACASERSVSESIAAGHPCFDPDGPPDHDWKYVDDSFSHEFGTEICGHYECARCDAIKPE